MHSAADQPQTIAAVAARHYPGPMKIPSFSHVSTWVFDLDNTLYPPSARLFDQIEVRMTDWVMQSLKVDRPEADRLRRHYWAIHGTTLAGLMREHQIDPAPYLTDVHDINFDALIPDPTLAAHIRACRGGASSTPTAPPPTRTK
jgi:putative hydrolase of the HAD superfamily